MQALTVLYLGLVLGLIVFIYGDVTDSSVQVVGTILMVVFGLAMLLMVIRKRPPKD
jgi:hypothetical protein